MTQTDKSYLEYYGAIMEISRLKVIINTNFRLKFIPRPIIEGMISKRSLLNNMINTKYKDYKYYKKINGVNFFLN